MKTQIYDYELPADLLARAPRELNGEKRSDSKMIVINKSNGDITHSYIKNFTDFFQKGDLVILNNSKTINAVFKGKSAEGQILDIALCRQLDSVDWVASINQKVEDNMFNKKFFINDDKGFTVSKKYKIEGLYEIEFFNISDIYEFSLSYGSPIMSNYVLDEFNISYYQNEYSQVPGSVELPAAGRHFTNELIQQIKWFGIDVDFITLHTGLSSMSITSENIEDHVMYEEHYHITKEVADKINATKSRGNKIIAIGTTVTRCLESATDDNGNVISGQADTSLYIYEGYKFKVIDALVTNFHGPRTSRIALASALGGTNNVLKAYKEAIDKGYKFFEFGDATLIL